MLRTPTFRETKRTIKMSIEEIKTQIDKFLASSTPEVIAIKGDWGVGKTYSWKKFLNEAKQHDQITLNRYSYVSLFGINSLEVFKHAIFENAISKEMIGEEASITTFAENAFSIIGKVGRKSILDIFKGTPILKGFSPTIESLAFLYLNETIICIDDLERRGENLKIKDVLGLVSLLKEQKKCKIVLLLNDDEEGLDDYKKYREKVIDTELKFAPTATECTSIAYEGNDYVYETLVELTKNLNIKNIRILKKIEKLIILALPYLEGYEQEVIYQIISSLTLFSFCYYGDSAGAPSLDFVTNIGYKFWGIGDDKDESEECKRWKTVLGEYGYQHTDELDLVLAEAVRTGYFVESTLKQEATKKNDQIITSKSEESFSDAWRSYHDSFADNKGEVINTLYESFKHNAKNITPLNLNGTVTLFRELGENEKASELIDFYINLRKEEKRLFNLEENNFFGDIRDAEIIEKFQETYSTTVTTESAEQVLERIAGKNGCNQEDEVILANTAIEEYYRLFKSATGHHLTSYINTCLKFGQFSNSNEQQMQIANRAKEALLRIASESEINCLRVKKYGVQASTK
jgi:hypothetical protein